ncbi:MAG: VanW family protein [Lachnospiraceae bacterium]|nr:VanW family protein [Lachnospiraceae bacterium]
MKRFTKIVTVLCIVGVACGVKYGVEAYAVGNNSSEQVFKNGIYMGNINAAGKTLEEVKAEVEEYVEDLQSKTITLSVFDNKVEVTGADMGISCGNLDVLTEALEYGTKGNIIERYKALKDLENQPLEYNIDLQVDQEALKNMVVEKCEVFNQEAVDATLEKTSSGFTVHEGQDGIVVNEEETIKGLEEFVTKEWKGENAEFEVNVQVEKPRGDAEQLAKVKDVLGAFSTDFSSSGSSRSTNVTNGTNLVNGTLLYPGDSFSMYETVSPFTEENGYYMAGSYLNGQVVESFGGGICQVSTTLYNAVLRAELQVDERFNHSMIVTYVDPSADAAIAGTSKDLKFTNNTENPIYIEGYTANKKVYFNIYGCETRDTANRKVTFESVTVSKTEPGAPKLVADGGQPIGYFKTTQSAHTGYVAELYKVVTENGVEVSRERVNKSTYQMSPQYVTVGTASADPNAVAAMNAAIATGDLNTAKATAAQQQAAQQAAELAAQQAAAWQALQQQQAAEQAAQQAAQQQQPQEQQEQQPQEVSPENVPAE